MAFVRSWFSETLRASVAIVLVPVALLATLALFALGSGIGGVSSLKELVGGPQLPAPAGVTTTTPTRPGNGQTPVVLPNIPSTTTTGGTLAPSPSPRSTVRPPAAGTAPPTVQGVPAPRAPSTQTVPTPSRGGGGSRSGSGSGGGGSSSSAPPPKTPPPTQQSPVQQVATQAETTVAPVPVAGGTASDAINTVATLVAPAANNAVSAAGGSSKILVGH